MRYILLISLICFPVNLLAQEIQVDNSNFFYQISPLFDFKESVVSLTFDDGYRVQFETGISILKEKKIPATFYVITGHIDSITKKLISKISSKDYEIGSHTVTHPDLIKIGNTDAFIELTESREYLKNNFGPDAGLTMSYPWGIYNKSVKNLAKNIYLAARSTNVGYNSFHSLDRFELQMQNFDRHVGYEKANYWVNYAIRNHLWLIEMIHGLNQAGYSPIDSAVFSDHLDYIVSVNNKIWCSTVGDVIKYLDESYSTRISCELCTDTVYKIRIDDMLSDTIYDQPVSIRIKVPGNWDNITISGIPNLRTEVNNKSKFILFNALPDNKLLTIRPGLISDPEKESGFRLVYLSANPLFDKIDLSLDALNRQDLNVVLFDMNGKIIVQQVEKAAYGIVNLRFDTSGLRSGVYFIRVTSNYNGYNIIKRLIKV